MARLTYGQVATLLNSMYNQRTGRSEIGNLPFATYQQVFSTDIVQNNDNLYNAIETVLAGTIFAIRPYSDSMRGLEWEPKKYGDVIRKITPITVPDIDNDEWNIAAELAKENPDFACCSAPQVQDILVTRITGGNTFARKWTIYRNQLNAAFHSESEVADFFSMLLTERENRLRVDKENEKYALLANVILATAQSGNTNQVFKALTAYNSETGLSLTKADIMQPDNFRPFMIWLSARIDNIRKSLTRLGVSYHANITGKVIDRHSPFDRQVVILHDRFRSYFDANKAMLFNQDRVGMPEAYNSVLYWQNPDDPFKVQGTAKTIASDGSVTTLSNEYYDNIIGLIMDEDCAGISLIDIWTAPEQFNPRFAFRNTWYHETFRSLYDPTENAIVIQLE